MNLQLFNKMSRENKNIYISVLLPKKSRDTKFPFNSMPLLKLIFIWAYKLKLSLPL